MTTVKRSALVPYSAAQMYELVRKVEDYPDFLPWCSGSRVLETYSDGVSAQVDISKGGMNKSFSTRNTEIKDSEIKMQLLEGPFSHLNGRWLFEAIADAGCRISLNLEFDFSSTLAKVTVGSVFNVIADSMLDAFIQRAETVYE